MGSSGIKLWKTLAQDFPIKRNVINCGFGGSQIVDSTHFADRIIVPHEPKMIILAPAKRYPRGQIAGWSSKITRISSRRSAQAAGNHDRFIIPLPCRHAGRARKRTSGPT